MENTKKVLDELKNINSAYGLPEDKIDEILMEMPDAKVCMPIIGKFSSGKSALVNTLLGHSRKLLKEDITPETAVPAEIVYENGGDYVRLFRNDGAYKDIEVDQYREIELDATRITHVRVAVDYSFLEEIPDVMVVDMPGFESGYEIHNRAIDDYLPQSLAYIVAFPADDMIVRASVGNILRELALNNMPICVCITKCDKKNDEFDTSLEKLKESLKKYIGERKIEICQTSSFVGDAEDVKNFLVQIEEQSQAILSKKFGIMALPELEKTENYLKMNLKNSELSESELDEEEERLEKQMAGLGYKFSGEKEEFDKQVSEAIEEIRGDVAGVLEKEELTLVAMVMNKQDISGHINSVIRSAVTTSVNRRFIPRVEKYLKHVKECIDSEAIGDVHVTFNYNVEEIGKGITASAVVAVVGSIFGLPILGAIAAYFLKKSSDNKKREEQKAQIRAKLNAELYPQIMKDVENGVKIAITKQMTLINNSIEEEFKKQKEMLDKAISDLRERISDEKSKKENSVKGMKANLAKIETLRQCLSV